MKVLFMHGLNSSSQTNKFSVITAPKKCFDVDYSRISHDNVLEFYKEAIKTYEPDLIVGHSLGGYWALTLSSITRIPCVLVNPQLKPNLPEYKDLTTDEAISERFREQIPAFSYLERGDEVIDVEVIENTLRRISHTTIVDGGHHRVQWLENINKVIKIAKSYDGIG